GVILKKRLLLTLLLLFAFSLVLVACGGEQEDAPADEVGETDEAETESGGEEPEYLSLLTGGTSGTYYPLGGAIASIISEETGIQTDALSSNASADNIVALRDGEAEIAFTQTDVASDAIEG